MYRYPTQSEEVFLFQALLKKVYQGIEWFPSWRLQWMTVLSMSIRGIRAGDWHILLSCYVTLFWLRVKFNKFPSCEYNVRTHKKEDSTLEHNCNVMYTVSSKVFTHLCKCNYKHAVYQMNVIPLQCDIMQLHAGFRAEIESHTSFA